MRGFACVVPLAFALCTTGAARAFEVSPLVHELAPSGRAATATLTVRNPSDQALALEFSTYRLDYSAAGARRGVAAEEELLVFPPAARIPPRGTQAVRIQWVGDPEIARARSYFCTVEQLPLEDAATAESAGGDGVQVLVTFNAIVHVTPPDTRARLAVTDSRLENDGGASTLALELRNGGDANAYGDRLGLVIESAAREIALTPADLEGAELFLPPGFRRRLRIVLPGAPWREPVSVRVVYGDER